MELPYGIKPPRGHFVHAALNKSIGKYGWIVTGVPGGLIYTVGLLDQWGHPELSIHGMTPVQSDELIKVMVPRVVGGYKFNPGLHRDVVQEYPVKLIEVHPSNFSDWLGQALDYHTAWSTEPLQVLQMLWPDREGRFPGELGYSREFERQKRFSARVDGYDRL